MQLGWVVCCVLSTHPRVTPRLGDAAGVCSCQYLPCSFLLAPPRAPALRLGSKPQSPPPPLPPALRASSRGASLPRSPVPLTHCPFHRLFIPDCLSRQLPSNSRLYTMASRSAVQARLELLSSRNEVSAVQARPELLSSPNEVATRSGQ
jgi:hypothetical protein